MKRMLLLFVVAAFVVALVVVTALGQGEQACNGLRKAVEQQDTSGPDRVNEKVDAKAQSACVKSPS